jgi:hypothetical protein
VPILCNTIIDIINPQLQKAQNDRLSDKINCNKWHANGVIEAKRVVDTTPDCSRVVPHPSTKPAQYSLTSEFGWDLVHSV